MVQVMSNMSSFVLNDELNLLSQIAKQIKVARIDIAYSDPITHVWYASNTFVLDDDNVRADSRVYNSILRQFNKKYGVPINYLVKHYNNNSCIFDLKGYRFNTNRVKSFKTSSSQLLKYEVESEEDTVISKQILNKEFSLSSNNEDNFLRLQEFFSNLIFDTTSTINSIYVLPYVTHVNGKNTISSFCIVSFIEKIQNDDILLEYLFYILKSLTSTELGNRILKNQLKETIKSAVSAIMSRNMSHNLGSHYLYYTKAQLDKLSSNIGEWGPKVRGASKVLGYVQARMDYLATVISNDKYPYGAVNFKSQIFDELTVDKFSKRHFDESKKDQRITNYLLANLIKSENFTVPDIVDDSTPDGYSRLDICVKLYNEETKKYDYFSGYDTVQHDETYVKNRLSNLYIALPGGIMSSHALFNVIENFIRNSAKYLQSDFQHYGLVFNILLRPSVDKRFIDLIIYDNKQNANRVLSRDNSTNKTVTLYQSILDKLSTLKIINSANEIEKDCKGFKEMLFSSVWMKAYEFKDRTYADIITEINLEEDENAKLALIEKYGFSLVQVYDPFRECDDEELSLEDEILKLLSSESSETDCGNTDEEQIVIADLCNLNLIRDYADKANLGIKLRLPLFNNAVSFKTIPSTEDGALKKNIESMLAVYSDIICVDEEYYNPENKISHCFTRAYSGQKTKPVEILREMLWHRFPDFDKYQLVFDNKTEYNSYDISETELSKYDIAGWDNYQKERMSYRIVFRRHLNSKEGIDFNNFSNYAYADTVSGGNFTITINDLITQNLTEYGYIDEESEYFALKVKESALTRITIIDERLFNSMSGREAEYMVKNLRVLNYNKLEDDIANCVGLIDKFLSNEISYDAYKNNLQCELSAIIENIANQLNRSACSERWSGELISSIDFDKLSESDSVEANKKCLSDTIVSKICEIADYKISIVFEGNRFKDGYDDTHFLSIHLGLIEKILKNSCIVNKIIDSRLHVTDESYNRLDQDRVVEFMAMIKELFGSTDLYVAIHSGRGNFSKELEGPLASYPFISLSALENAFNNSKYLLSQIFYNTIYIGKGLANN